jgi:gluconate:H+ symporter, GntP family
MMSGYNLVLMITLTVIGLVVLVAYFKLNSFVALALVSLGVGLFTGMNPPEVVKAFSIGLGNVLGSIAMVIGLGAILGKLLAESGGAEQIATTLIQTFGPTRASWLMAFIAFIVGLPVFFGVGLVLLLPIALTVARQINAPILQLGLPLVAGLSVAHGLVPPHPGPVAAVGLLNADMGKTIVYAVCVGLPTLLIAGPFLGRLLARPEQVESGPIALQLTSRTTAKTTPGFTLALFTILLPILLMLFGTVAEIISAKTSPIRLWAGFMGHPIVAMLAATLFAFGSFGYARGFDKQQLLSFSETSLAPIAQILLVVGAGGGLSQVLIQSGAGNAIAQWAIHSPISPLVLGWLVAALIRVTTGSATVAITTASGILVPIANFTPGLNRELLVVALGAGSLILSHVNDGGFWLVKEYLNMSVTQTLKTWTVLETAISVLALAFTLLFNRLI